MDKNLITRDITKEFGLEHMSEEEQNQALQDVGQAVIQGAVMRVLADMSDEDTATFESFLEKDPSPEELVAFLTEKEPRFENMLREEVEALKREVLRVNADA